MSIWCSWPEIGYDMWPGDGVHDDVAYKTLGDRTDPNVPNGGEVRSYAEGFSNHYPTRDGEVEQRANIGLAHCPVWCVPGHGDDFDDDTVGEWVRLDVYTAVHDYQQGGTPSGEYVNAAVVLDEAAARALVADLSAWLDRPKAHPSSVVSA